MAFSYLTEWSEGMSLKKKLSFFSSLLYLTFHSAVHSQKVSHCCMINTVDAFILNTGANAKNHGQYSVHKKLPSCKANARSQTVSTSICLHSCQPYQLRLYANASGPVQKHFCMKCY